MLNRLWLWFRSLLFARRLEREMREEIAAHLARATERLMADGLSREAAERGARREFGNLEVIREEARDARGGRSVEWLAVDVRFALRWFARQPVSTMTMIVVLALGIGFNTALFLIVSTLVSGLPPGMAADGSRVRIRGGERSVGRGYTVGREFPYPEYREYAAQTGMFSAVAAWTSADVAIDVGRGQESLHSGAATFVTSNYFQVLGVAPIAGAGFPADGSTDAGTPQLVAVISHVVWERYYGRADVIGRTLEVNDVPVTIVGIAPRRFNGARTGGSQVRVWLPLNARPVVQRASAIDALGYDTAIFGIVARLQPGIEASDTQSIAQAIAARSSAQMTSTSRGQMLSTDVVPLLADNYFPPSGEAPQRLLGIIAPLLIPVLILSITGTTVSALQAGLAVARRREIAVRLALGAPRRRLVRQLVTESVMLALAAGGLGLFIIWILLRTFESAAPDLQIAIERRSLLFTTAVALATGILFGLSPALHATRLTVSDVLKAAAGAFIPSRLRLQAALVVAQIALTQPALLGMGTLFLEIADNLRQLPAAVDADRILEARFNTNPRYGPLDGTRERTLARLQARFAALPGVTAVVPQENTDDYVAIAVHPADRVASADSSLGVRAHAAPPGYFSLMSLPIARGSGFDPAQAETDAMVIGTTLARRLWGEADPIGRRITGSAPNRASRVWTVVGVVDDSRAGRPGDPRVFVPMVRLTGHFLIRTQGPAQPIIPLIRSVANSEAPELALVSTRTLTAIEDGERTGVLKAMAAVGAGGMVALLLSAIGLYAVVAFAVGQRVREIGIRTALGADHRRILVAFLRGGLNLSVIGVFVGLAISLAAVRLIAVVRGEGPPSGTAAIAAMVTVVVTGVALLATWIPARRATRIDPIDALRQE